MTNQSDAADGYYHADACDVDAFKSLINRTVAPALVPQACDIQKNIPIYDMGALRGSLENHAPRRALMGEWAQVLLNGAGVLVLRGAYDNTAVLDEATSIYENIIAAEKLATGGGGDHFAASGANDRIWNSLQKLCEASPDVFLRYFANTSIAAVSEAWLGPNYQMSAQINVVHPGGAAQQAHRDYHLGFQTAEANNDYPSHVHDLSAALTLQGAIAHCNMPIESGPTKLLPFSHLYREGYVAWRRDDFRAVFEERYVQLPLEKGDALFFNPALFHAAGANTSRDIARMANLLQVSSAFGRAMESIDRQKMCALVYPAALASQRDATLSTSQLHAALSATAEGYSFPTNLDRDPPKGGLAPETQRAFMMRAISERLSEQEVSDRLMHMAQNQRA